MIDRLSEIRRRASGQQQYNTGTALDHAERDREYLLQLVDRLEGYVQHAPGCLAASINGEPCDCGLTRIQKEVKP